MINNESEQKLDRKLQREIRQLHRRRARLAALGLDSVQPPPIVNRRTGETITFGQRRAYDGAWVIEMLGASGCTREDIAAAIFVLEALIEHEDRHGWKVDKDLLELLKYFHEPVPLEQLRQMWGRSQSLAASHRRVIRLAALDMGVASRAATPDAG